MSEKIAAIDYGRKRIGIALADLEVGIAFPYENNTRRGDQEEKERFRRLVVEEDVVRFVVGLPVHLDGRESWMSGQARKFGNWLQAVTGVSVEFFDERFTSSEAAAQLAPARLSRKKHRARHDMVAAQVLLTAYLESGGAGREPLRGLDD